MNLKDWWCDENMHIKVGKGGFSMIRKGGSLECAST